METMDLVHYGTLWPRDAPPVTQDEDFARVAGETDSLADLYAVDDLSFLDLDVNAVLCPAIKDSLLINAGRL